MSVATLENHGSTSQLFFAWSEDTSLNDNIPVSSPTASVTGSSAIASSIQRYPAVTEPPARGTGPVRIGKVMLQLLRKYGISDEEIEEGIAAYARRRASAHCPAVSS